MPALLLCLTASRLHGFPASRCCACQVDLPTQLGLDLVHCERAAQAVVADASGTITQAQVRLVLGGPHAGLA